ncbi:MAG: hypothetical protein WC483_00180 [Candidatus Paceibacterota bacterium]
MDVAPSTLWLRRRSSSSSSSSFLSTAIELSLCRLHSVEVISLFDIERKEEDDDDV